MSSTIEASPPLPRLLDACSITDPETQRTCIGLTLHKSPCKNRVSVQSRKDARSQLKMIAMGPLSASLPSKLQSVAELLLCKRDHQCQAESVGQKWLERIESMRIPTGENPTIISWPDHPEDRHHGRNRRFEVLDRIEVPSLPETSPMIASGGFPDGRPAASPSMPDVVEQDVTPDLIRANQVPFFVSSRRPAAVTVPRQDNSLCRVRLRSFRQGCQAADVNCGICRSHDSIEAAYVCCTECSGEFHWDCLERWLYYSPSDYVYSCPSCRIRCDLDGFHCTPHEPVVNTPLIIEEPAAEPAEEPIAEEPMPSQTPSQLPEPRGLERGSIDPAELSLRSDRGGSHWTTILRSSAPQPLRRSGRATRPPDRFV